MNEMLSEIRECVVRVETKIDTMTDVDKTANEALASTRSAHKRIDKIDNTLFLVVTTIIGSVIVGIMALLMKGDF